MGRPMPGPTCRGGPPEDVLAHSAAADKQIIASEVPFRQVICECPVDLLKTSLWVISGHTDKSAPCPLYPNNGRWAAHPSQHLAIGLCVHALVQLTARVGSDVTAHSR